MIETMIALLLAGFLAKSTDELVDTLNAKRLAILPAIAYGVLGAWAVTQAPVLAPLAIGIIAGVAITKKLNAYPHVIGALAFTAVLVNSLPPINKTLTIVFALAAIIDEIGNELAEKKKFKSPMNQFFHYRLFVETIALAVSLATSRWEFITAIVAFDTGYIIAEKINGKAILASQ